MRIYNPKIAINDRAGFSSFTSNLLSNGLLLTPSDIILVRIEISLLKSLEVLASKFLRSSKPDLISPIDIDENLVPPIYSAFLMFQIQHTIYSSRSAVQYA